MPKEAVRAGTALKHKYSSDREKDTKNLPGGHGGSLQNQGHHFDSGASTVWVRGCHEKSTGDKKYPQALE